MSTYYFSHSGRAKRYWKLRNTGYRDLLIGHGWGMRGAYAEKSINGVSIMQTIVARYSTYLLCCFQRKADFWSDITRRERETEAIRRRAGFYAVPANTADPMDPPK